MSPSWVKAIRDQCLAAGVAFFFKQLGATRKYLPAVPLLPMRTSLPRCCGGQVRTQTGCTAAQAGRSAC
ncbi:MAG: DUF5131 family protein [Desulfobacterales bacterium]|nr:DUF5131 family protein [Desulfobacterales bacterium]